MTTINERIAKAKGWKYDHECLVGYTRTETNSLRSRDWSGSIADAWELVDEVSAAGFVVFVGVSSEKTASVSLMSLDRHIPSTKAPTAAEAIALAWLAVNEVE